jgi:hypothetical protein
MRTQGVMRHQLVGDLFGERGFETASDVDRRQFLVLARVVLLQFRTFQLEVGLFGVCLPATPATMYAGVRRVRGCHAQHQTGRRENPVVRA